MESTQPPIIIVPVSQPYHRGSRVNERQRSPTSRSRRSYSRSVSPVSPHSGHPPIIIQGSSSSWGSSSSSRRAYDQEQSAYTAVDPFRPSVAPSINFPPHAESYYYYDRPHHHHSSYPTYTVARRTVWRTLLVDSLTLIWHFIFDTLPRQFYLHFLLRLPAFYFSRVAHIFEEADMTMSEIKGMALATLAPMTDPNSALPDWDDTIAKLNSNLKTTWESFIDSLLREWKTLNIVSVLLLSAIVTILQIDGAANDPIARHAALLSLICALMSLLYGCIYIIRFGSMRKTYKAAEWAAEAQKTKTVIWWNVWVLLAMPAIWLAWSIVLYIVCIMAFVWRTGTSDGSHPLLSQHAALGPRIAISAVLALGVIYSLLIINTFRRYGDAMDKAWRARVAGWARDKGSREKRLHAYPDGSWHSSTLSPQKLPEYYYSRYPTGPATVQNLTSFQGLQPRTSMQSMQGYPSMRSAQTLLPTQIVQPPSTQIMQPPPSTQPPSSTQTARRYRSRSRSRSVSRHRAPHEFRDSSPSAQVLRPSIENDWHNPDYSSITVPTFVRDTIIPPSSYILFKTFKVMDLRFQARAGHLMPDVLSGRGIHIGDWMQFIFEASHRWSGDVPLYQWNSSEELLSPQDAVADLVERWNSTFFYPRGTRMLLCQEYLPGYPYSPVFAIYLVDWFSPGGQPLDLEERFESILESLERIDIFDPPPYQPSRMGTSIFSKQHLVRGPIHVGISLRRQLSAPVTRPSSPLSTITEVTERSSRSRQSPPGVQIPASTPNHPEEIGSLPERSRSSSRSSGRRSRWSRSPPHVERPGPNDREVSDMHRPEPSSPSPPDRPTSPMMYQIGRYPDVEIRQSASDEPWMYGAQSHANGGPPPAQPIVYVGESHSAVRDVRPDDQHRPFVDRELRPHADDRSWRHEGQPPIIYARTDPPMPANDILSSRRHSRCQSSRHGHRHHSVPVGCSSHLPSDLNSRKSTASLAQRTHRTHTSTSTSASTSRQHTMSYHDQEYPTPNGVRAPSASSGPPPPLPSVSESRDVYQDGMRKVYPPLPLLSPLTIKPMSIDFAGGYIQNDSYENEQHPPGGQPPTHRSTPSENRLGHGGVIEGPWKRDVDSLHFIMEKRP